MIPSPTTEPTTPEPAPSIGLLGCEGRMHLLAWAEMQVLIGLPVDASSWRVAWGEAADYQTVVDARRVLAKGRAS